MALSSSRAPIKGVSQRSAQTDVDGEAFNRWILSHFKTNTLRKAKAAIVAIDSEIAVLREDALANQRIIKGLSMQNSQLSAQLLKLNSLLSRRGEVLDVKGEKPSLTGLVRADYEQRLLLTLQQVLVFSPAAIHKIVSIQDKEQRLNEISLAIEQGSLQLSDSNRRLQLQVDSEQNSVDIIMNKDRMLEELSGEIANLRVDISAREEQLRKLQCMEQESSLRYNALSQQLESLQERNSMLVDSVSAINAQNNELIATIDGLKQKILTLEAHNHIDSVASEELMTISVEIGTSLCSANAQTEIIQTDIDRLNAETQVSLVRLTDPLSHSVTSHITEQVVPDISPTTGEVQLADTLKRIWSYILSTNATITGARALVKDDITTSISDITLINSPLQRASYEISQSLSEPLGKRRQQKTGGCEVSTQTVISLAQVAKMLANEKRLRDKISLLENDLKGRIVTLKTLEEKIRQLEMGSPWINLSEARIDTPWSSFVQDNYDVETQTDERLIIEAPDPSWPDFHEKMEIFERTLNNLYLAIQQQKSQTGTDLRMEDLAATIRIQVLEALHHPDTAVVSATNNLDLSIITDDITDYDRSLLHLQRKKAEQRTESRGIFPFWK